MYLPTKFAYDCKSVFWKRNTYSYSLQNYFVNVNHDLHERHGLTYLFKSVGCFVEQCLIPPVTPSTTRSIHHGVSLARHPRDAALHYCFLLN